MPEVGSQAPDFTLHDTNRERVSLSNFRGKSAVLVAFFPGAFTGVCTKEMCALRDSMAAFNELGTTVLGVSVDAPAANAGFKASNGLNFTLLSDYKREATNAYGIALENFGGLDGLTVAQRSVFLVDRDGKITYAWVAANPGVEPDYDAIEAAVKALG